ncbi:hypothetical protein [Neisseria dumasiana]|uniref:hypothetical protein n=1 Tax=Neisseria dumasiana TaxID=1931275 RepID=UPI000A18BFA4|nr:hypothetical protein [Neisseria dumasiana]
MRLFYQIRLSVLAQDFGRSISFSCLFLFSYRCIIVNPLKHKKTPSENILSDGMLLSIRRIQTD